MLGRFLFPDCPREDLFRWRSPETSRIEGFSDAAFGFAITLLVVSLDVPRTSAALLEALRGFIGLAATFTVLFGFWKAQFTFFRRYGLEDDRTINLTGVFLFLVLFVVYPLKFVVEAMSADLLSGGAAPSPFTSREHAVWFLAAYGGGFAGILITLALMYAHAYGQRDRLALGELERFETVESLRKYAIAGGGSLIFAFVPAILWIPSGAGQKAALRGIFAVSVAVVLAGLVYRVRLRKRRAEIVARHLAAQGAGT
jgi:uncharacterized membrane protein